MADDKKAKAEAVDKDGRPLLYLAEYDSPADVMHAAEKVRDAGYERWDVHTPFPVHGMDRAMGLPDSKVGWIVLLMGLTGCTTAFLLMWWTNGVDYPIVIGGKPGFSIPSMIPVMFELTILLSALGCAGWMFLLNGLPRLYHPTFKSERFARVTDDRFFVWIDARDPKFDEAEALLEKIGASYVETVTEVVE